VNTYDKNQTPFLKVDAHFLAVESAIKGFMKASVAEGPIDANRRAEFESLLEGWLASVLNMQFEDPLIRRRVIQLAVSISTTILEHKPEMMLKTLEHVSYLQP
jgi:exportin-5